MKRQNKSRDRGSVIKYQKQKKSCKFVLLLPIHLSQSENFIEVHVMVDFLRVKRFKVLIVHYIRIGSFEYKIFQEFLMSFLGAHMQRCIALRILKIN